jgi:hypothetical protein
MTCAQPSGTTKGIVVAYQPTDTGGRPLADGTPFYESPDIRLAVASDVPGLRDPANWDPPNPPWNGQVQVGSAYQMLVRIRNSDPKQQRASLNLQGWVSDYTAGGVGPGSVIRPDKTQPPGPQNPPAAFTGFSDGPLPAGNPDNPGDPFRMFVLVSNELWTPTDTELAINGGHVCAAVNVWADATANGTTTPVDGQSLFNSFLDPSCDRRYGQRNLMIVPKPRGVHVRENIMLMVPATERRPLRAEIATRRVMLAEGRGGVLEPVPALAGIAGKKGITQLRSPVGNPLQQVQIGGRDSYGDDDDDGLKLHLEPGGRVDLKMTIGADRHERRGDAYAFDVITTDIAANRLFGAARVYVLVT